MKKTFYLLLLVLFTSVLQIQAQTEIKTFRGTIGEYDIEMDLRIEGNKISGNYYYIGPADSIGIKGKINQDGTFLLEQFDGYGKKTTKSFTGEWKQSPHSNGITMYGTYKDLAKGEELSFFAEQLFVNVNEKIKLTTRYYDDINEKKRFEIKARYPEIIENNSPSVQKFNQIAKSRAMNEVEEFRKSMMEYTAEDLEFLPEGMSNFIEIGFTIEYADENLVSVNFSRSEYTGGAHPNSWTLTLNYDLKNNRELQLADLFKPNSKYLQAISDYNVQSLIKQQGEYADRDWIGTGAGATSENFKNWNFTKKGLMFTFDAYQVAAYAAGPFTVIMPYEKFADEMQSELFYPVSTVSYIDGSPANWCRGGRWTMLDTEFKLATIKGKKNARAYFYGDENDCPNGTNCRKKSYVIAGDEVIVQRTYGNFACSWFQPKKGFGTVGWISLENLSIQENTKSNDGDWTGEWIYGENNIDIKAAKSRGKYTVKGNAFWKGLGDNIHIGELDYEGLPEKDKMKVGDGVDKYDCQVKMQRLGKFLIVSDNLMCGGANVSFNGIYQRK